MSVDVDHVSIHSDGAVIELSLTNSEPFGELLDRHWEAIHRYCRSRAGSSDGEGLAAETFRLTSIDESPMTPAGRCPAVAADLPPT